jgi:hypothetical protein
MAACGMPAKGCMTTAATAGVSAATATAAVSAAAGVLRQSRTRACQDQSQRAYHR